MSMFNVRTTVSFVLLGSWDAGSGRNGRDLKANSIQSEIFGV